MAGSNYYRIWCITEAAYVWEWANTEPAVCPNSGGHSIDASKTAICERRPVEYTTAPTVNDDESLGYILGYCWHDITADKAYVCMDNADGAAVWAEITGAGSGDILPVADTTSVVKGSGDPTKEVRIEADGLTTGMTRVLTMPDADITPDDASATRTPTAHKDSHKSGGGDELTASDLLEAPIKRIRTTTGPTDMVVGAVAEGEVLQRSGATIVGTSPAGLPVDDATAVVKGSGDDTKLVRIEADGLTTGTTRVLSMPDANITPDDASASRTPSTHAASHQDTGGDEISVAGLSGVLADPQTPTTHASAHENAGGDEVSVAGLSGLLADPQTPDLPVDDTESLVQDPVDNTKQMRIDVEGVLTGTVRVVTMPDKDLTLDDDGDVRPPASHAIGGSAHSADTLANLNGKVSDATLDDSSAARTPTSHAASHQDVGGDEISVAGLSGLLADGQTPTAHDLAGAEHNADTLVDLNAKVSDASLVALAGQIGGTAASPDVRGVRETGGPTLLTLGGIAEGEYARRSGSTLVGDTPAGGGDVTAAASLVDDRIIRGDGGVKGVQDTGIAVDETDNITGAGNFNGVTVEGHATRHQNAGADEISVVGLSGELADDQPPKAHKADHVSGGGDPFAATDLLEAIIKRLQTTTGPTTLLIGAVADGEYLKRSGTAVIGDTPSGGGGESYVDRGDPSAVDYSIGSGLTADGTWYTLDLSSIVPAGAASKAVHLRCRILDNGVESLMQIRKLGNTNAINATKTVTAVQNDSHYFDAWVTMDSSRRVEYNIDSGMNNAEVTVAGWMA